MGRIKTTLVKRVTNKLLEKHGNKLKKDFNQNKKVLKEYANIPSKKIRNVIAGYISRKKKQKQ